MKKVIIIKVIIIKVIIIKVIIIKVIISRVIIIKVIIVHIGELLCIPIFKKNKIYSCIKVSDDSIRVSHVYNTSVGLFCN